MSMDDLRDRYEDPLEKERSRWIGIWIGILAVALAICSMLGGNATKDMLRLNIEVSDTYNFYQAKNGRQMMLRNQAEGLESLLALLPNPSPEVRQAIDGRVKEHRMWADRYESDPKSNEGKKELLAKARELEAERNLAMKKDPYFDWSQALLQIAIVLASVAIVTGGRSVLLFSGLLGILGTLLLVNGHLLLVKVPLLG
jgi:hypothetical protein